MKYQFVHMEWCILILSVVVARHRCFVEGREGLDRINVNGNLQQSSLRRTETAKTIAPDSSSTAESMITNQTQTKIITTTFPSDAPSLSPSVRPSLPNQDGNAGTASSGQFFSQTQTPSDTPSLIPSLAPSANALNHALSLSETPSDTPSKAPSSIPSSPTIWTWSTTWSNFTSSNSTSVSPSIPIAILHSDSPSDNPSNAPSLRPSSLPSRSTFSSSELPSGLPSSSPRSAPSAQPSSFRSSLPSIKPSPSQSHLPSDAPSTVPSQVPSGRPSDLPSNVPATSPSAKPSTLPSSSTSHLMSLNPSRSSLPTVHPSSLPSLHPSGSPTDGSRNFSVTGTIVLPGISTTMNEGNITVFDGTAKTFLSRLMAPVKGVQVSVTSVEVVGQSVTGSRRHRRRRTLQQVHSDLSVHYRVHALVFPGYPSFYFNLTEQVDQAFVSHSNEFQEWLSIASPFFPSPTIVPEGAGSSNNNRDRTTAVYVSVTASFILLVALISMGAWLRRRCRAKQDIGGYLSIVGSTLTAGSDEHIKIPHDWILGREIDTTHSSPAVLESSNATFENIELARISTKEKQPKSFGPPLGMESDRATNAVIVESDETKNQDKQYSATTKESPRKVGNLISWLMLGREAEQQNNAAEGKVPISNLNVETAHEPVGFIDDNLTSIAQSSPAILEYTHTTPINYQYIQLEEDPLFLAREINEDNRISPSEDDRNMSKETEQNGGRVVAWFQRRWGHQETEPVQLEAPYYSDEDNHENSIEYLDEAVISFTQSSPAALQYSKLSSSSDDKMEHHASIDNRDDPPDLTWIGIDRDNRDDPPDHAWLGKDRDKRDDPPDHAWIGKDRDNRDESEPDRYAKETEERSLGNSDTSVIVDDLFEHKARNSAKVMFVPPREVVSPRRRGTTLQANGSNESKGDVLFELSFSSFESEVNSNATTEGSITDHSTLTNNSGHSDAGALVGMQSMCSMPREGRNGPFR